MYIYGNNIEINYIVVVNYEYLVLQPICHKCYTGLLPLPVKSSAVELGHLQVRPSADDISHHSS